MKISDSIQSKKYVQIYIFLIFFIGQEKLYGEKQKILEGLKELIEQTKMIDEPDAEVFHNYPKIVVSFIFEGKFILRERIALLVCHRCKKTIITLWSLSKADLSAVISGHTINA